MKTTTSLLASVVLAVVALAGCDAGRAPETNTMSTSSNNPVPSTHSTAPLPQPPTPEQWQRVAQMRVVFGHQSVGGDMLEGIRQAAETRHVPLVLAESRTPLAGAGIQHFKVGHNEKPETKLADFRGTLAASFADGVQAPDVALLKLCYIDFGQDIDPKQVAQQYIATVDELARAHPQTVFVPMTSPLTTVQTGPKAWLKKVLGKDPGGYADNARRQVFNETLRSRYATGGTLFDIAALESARGQSHVESDGARIEVLNPLLTYDGGHLNSEGQQLIGGALISHLATVRRP
jgi:lysophospholipase L1-like esterase